MSMPDQPDNNMVSDHNLALERTVLANERTYAAWIRTGIAALATGLGIAKFMMGIMPVWSILLVASMLIIFSGVAFLLAAWRYSHLHIKVAKLEVDAIPLKLAIGLSIVFVICALIALIFLWTMAA
jgi:putative membrane protein